MFFTLVGPFFFILYFAINDNKLRTDEGFFEKYETCFESTKVDNLNNIYYHAFFMFRRLIFVMNCIYLNGMFYTF
jgi:hypothetical protein